MASSCSSPSPPSSLKAPTLADAQIKEEEDEVEVGDNHPSSSAATANVLPGNGIDMSSVFQLQNNAAFQALLGAGAIGLGNNPNVTISTLFGNPKLTAMKREIKTESVDGDSPKKTRVKVFANGYFMTFDKVSSCQKKHFWRCEYKNTCKARMHTDILSEMVRSTASCATPVSVPTQILQFIHDHNHNPPTDDEIRLYGLDPTTIEKNQVYIVGNTADPNQRRKIRKQQADAEAAIKRIEQQQQEEIQRHQTAAAIAAAQAAVAQATGRQPSPAASVAAAASLLQAVNCPTSSATATSHAMLLAQLPFAKKEITQMAPPPYISPNLPLQTSTPTSSAQNLLAMSSGAIAPLVIPQESSFDASGLLRQGPTKRKIRETANEDEELRRDPMFEPTFEIARKLRKLWKGEPSRYPRTCTAPTRHFEFYLSKNDGTDEHLYMQMRIEQRDETHLKEALQEFCGQQCIGMLLFGISPKISVMFNQPMLCNWDNHQFFLLDISNPSRWRLMYVDDKAV
ncbi:unnamed protein product [Caenorhabditis sp. 36 PRJEB53466]|nr:unnamed protein product [Caenorhabditis sp. 36 PRJEB53466]